MSSLTSSQEFIHFLTSHEKTSNNKIEIISQAWQNTDFYLPRKEEVIAEWIIGRLIAASSKAIDHESPLFDSRYWTLLLSILTSSPKQQTWLPPLIHRLPPLTNLIIASFLASHHHPNSNELPEGFTNSIILLFPYASRRINIDGLGEVLRAIFRFLARGSGIQRNDDLFRMILGEYKRSFGVASAGLKKKVYNNFVQTYLNDWITALSSKTIPQQADTLGSLVLSVGTETLFCMDVLRFTECHLRGSSTATETRNEAPDSSIKLLDRLGELIKCDVVLDSLPVLYASYVHALYRHRSQLFGQGGGTTRDGVRNAACLFLDVVLGLVDGVEAQGGETLVVRVWRTRVGLLKVLLEEGGYVRSGEGEDETKGMLGKIVNRAIVVLETLWTTDTLKPLAIQSISIIIKIGYDIVRPFVPRILTRVLVLPCAEDGSYIEFLDLLLECHVKTRTLDELVGMMLNSVWEGVLLEGVKERRDVVVVEDDLFLERVGKAIGSFGTVGQSVGLVGCVAEFVERGLGVLKGVEKKCDQEDVGLRVGLGARVVCVVLGCLNFEMVSDDDDEGIGKLRVVKGRVDRMVRRLVRRLGRVEGVKREMEYGLCALLRVKYVFDQNVFVVGESEENLAGLMGLLECEDELVLPELVFELVRMMFLHISTRRGASTTTTSIVSAKGHGGRKGKGKDEDEMKQPFENERFFDTLLAFVESYYPKIKTNTGWSGTDHDLSTRGREGKTKCAIALVWMIVERWLSELDLLAMPRQIRRFLDVVFQVGVVDLSGEKKEGNGLVDPEGVLLNMLHSAWFWEFGRIRKELVELLKERTSPVSTNRGDIGLLQERISTFRVLLYFPSEYFSFQVLGGFVGCAVEVDRGLARIWKKREGERDGEEEVMRGLVVLRVFMRRVCVYVGGGGVLDFRGKSEAKLLLRMLEEPIDMDCDVKEAYLSASLDLAEVWLIKLFKTSRKNDDPEPVLRVLKTFDVDSICGRRGHKRTLTFECFLLMVELLDRELGLGTPNGVGVHEDVLEALRELRDELVEGLYVRILKELVKEGLEDEVVVKGYVGLVRVWDGLICLGRCVGDENECRNASSRFVGDKLVSVLMPYVQSRDVLDGGLVDLCHGVFSVILGEAECRSVSVDGDEHDGGDGRLRYLEVVLAIYVSWANKVSVSGMDVRLGQAAKRMTGSDFEHLLSFIAESLSGADSGETACQSRLLLESRLVRLVHLGSHLIHNHPSHSMACIQKFMARCLGLFNDNSIYVEGDALRIQVLEMVGQYCSAQQATLRAQDTSLIWLVISKVLAPCQVHDLETRAEIFHKLVSILMCLIRLRRDLVTLGLPHLGLILRRMVHALRGCRPNLGAKQMAIVMNTQPRWISHIRSLGGEEAKALSRLLESLTLKTTVRVAFYNVDGSTSKAESLSKPFSKHAAYVLKAYVEVMSDPLCVMSLEVRKELREGLFALCGMMSVHSRDALMVGGGLDAGGKGVLKSVWKEWEEVRYVGKG